MGYNRVSKDEYYLKIADAVSEGSTCLRRRYGAVIVKDDRILSTGYNGSPSGELNCSDIDVCDREVMGIPKGERYELCKAVHAEQNAIINLDRDKLKGATIYISGRNVSNNSYANPEPCLICRRFIVQAGIVRCVGMSNNGQIEIQFKDK